MDELQPLHDFVEFQTVGAGLREYFVGKKDLRGFKNRAGLEITKPTLCHNFNIYTKSINKAYKHTGSLFEKRFGRVLMDNDAYFVHLVSTIHRNPQRHGFISDFRGYPYSSYRAILEQRSSRVETEKGR